MVQDLFVRESIPQRRIKMYVCSLSFPGRKINLLVVLLIVFCLEYELEICTHFMCSFFYWI